MKSRATLKGEETCFCVNTMHVFDFPASQGIHRTRVRSLNDTFKRLRTFAQNFSTRYNLFKLLLRTDNDLLVSEMK